MTNAEIAEKCADLKAKLLAYEASKDAADLKALHDALYNAAGALEVHQGVAAGTFGGPTPDGGTGGKPGS